MKAKFSVPFNGDLALVKEALSSGRVSEVYFALPGRRSGASDHFVLPGGVDAAYGPLLPALARICAGFGVRTNLLCNAPSLALTPLTGIFAAAKALKVASITLADPLFIDKFRRALPEVALQASVIMNLRSEERVRQMLRAGVGTLTLAAEVNRDLPLLRRIKKLKAEFPGFKVKLMANYYCGYDCVFMNAHYLSGMFGGRGTSAAGGGCFFRGGDAAEGIRRPFIRPEDIGLYVKDRLADEFKLIARYQASSVLRKIYAAYFRGKFGGDLGELLGGKAGDYAKSQMCYMDNSLFPKGFAGKVGACDKNCASCGYCRRVFGRVTAGSRRRNE
ncbi:MAG: hypothetical protein A2234_11300 [Elusimicrobia bacterium RIFOXYA2_FULL_58_8]|nr:MAG: hypothetical protein A2285_02850 [Elusimicrobia bacterium RIFOXYA12_FULL_57_11]OGS14525.1 MAG: hypothetical protein A2234_11300 [Elusimicrobia bacterium RIFOXYA2_FULL_58_8]